MSICFGLVIICSEYGSIHVPDVMVQEFVNVLEEEGMDPFSHWYSILWEERGEDGGYEGEEAEGSLRLWVKFSPRVV